jgi:hypothetical protein
VSARIVRAQSFFFHYLKYQLEEFSGNEVPVHSAQLSQTQKVMLDSLAASRKRVKLNGQLIRIFDKEDIMVVRKIFGATFGIGITQPIPLLKILRGNPSLKRTVWLRNHDTVCIVSCSPSGKDADRCKEKQLFTPHHSQLQCIPI